MSQLDGVVTAFLTHISPSGALIETSKIAEASAKLDALTREFNAQAQALAHLDESLVSRLETDFAQCVLTVTPDLAPLEDWAIPILSAFAGPASPLVSVGLRIACKVAIAALSSWAKRRTGGK